MDEHVRFQFSFRVWGIETDLDGPGVWIEKRINESHYSREDFSGVRLCLKRHFLTLLNPDQIRFISVKLNPNPGQIRDGVNTRSGFYVETFEGIFVEDHTTYRSQDGHTV